MTQRPLTMLDQVGSTNDEALSLGRAGAAHGTAVAARRQSAGRGRRGHVWESPEGNLYLFVSSNDEWDVDSLFTIYEGYFVELIQYHDDYSQQTEADDDFARSLLYGIAFSTNEDQAQ